MFLSKEAIKNLSADETLELRKGKKPGLVGDFCLFVKHDLQADGNYPHVLLPASLDGILSYLTHFVAQGHTFPNEPTDYYLQIKYDVARGCYIIQAKCQYDTASGYLVIGYLFYLAPGKGVDLPETTTVSTGSKAPRMWELETLRTGDPEERTDSDVLIWNPAEPPLRGGMSCGLNVHWLNWHRLTTGGSLRESREEGMRRLGLPEQQAATEPGEPSLVTPGGSGPSQEWVRWYRQHKGCGLKEAVLEGRDRLLKM